MIQKIIIKNLLVVLFFYCVPILVFRYYQQDYKNIAIIQNAIFITIFFGSSLLAYFNFNTNPENLKVKITKKLFMYLGFLGIIYSGIVLYLFFAFRRGIGF